MDLGSRSKYPLWLSNTAIEKLEKAESAQEKKKRKKKKKSSEAGRVSASSPTHQRLHSTLCERYGSECEVVCPNCLLVIVEASPCIQRGLVHYTVWRMESANVLHTARYQG